MYEQRNRRLADKYVAKLMFMVGKNASPTLTTVDFIGYSEAEARGRAFKYARNVGVRGFKIECEAISLETGELVRCA